MDGEDIGRQSLQDVWSSKGIVESALTVDDRGTIADAATAMARRSVDEEIANLPCLIGEVGGPDGPLAHLELGRTTIGQGSMGVVTAAQQVPLCREVAVKTLRRERGDVGVANELLLEARVTGVLEHPNVVPVHMLGRSADGRPMIVMKRISGTSWRDFIVHPDKIATLDDEIDPLTWHIEILIKVCNAVHYAHSKGIIHRDLKPENVMIGAFGEVYVLDWGLAVTTRQDDPIGLPRASEVEGVAGTPAYMAPEMAAGDGGSIGLWTDVYLLGAILHECVTGEPRHQGDTTFAILLNAFASEPVEFDSAVPEELAEICNKATHQDQRQRYPDAQAFRIALADFLRHRHSNQLEQEAAARLAVLQTLLGETAELPDQQELEFYNVFGECRFAYQQAIREWHRNQQAIDGLQEALELVAWYEIRRKDYKAAKRLMADLPRPNPDLEAALEELAGELRAREVELAKLRALERDADLSIGMSTRSMTLMLMGVLWSIGYATLGLLARSGVFVAEYLTFINVHVAYGVFLGAAMIFRKDVLWENQVNRRFLWTLWAGFVAGMLFWPLAWAVGMSVGHGIAMNMLLYGVIILMSAGMVDKHLLWTVLPYVIGFVVAMLHPESGYYAFGGATLAGMSVAAFVWKPEKPGRQGQ